MRLVSFILLTQLFVVSAHGAPKFDYRSWLTPFGKNLGGKYVLANLKVSEGTKPNPDATGPEARKEQALQPQPQRIEYVTASGRYDDPKDKRCSDLYTQDPGAFAQECNTKELMMVRGISITAKHWPSIKAKVRVQLSKDRGGQVIKFAGHDAVYVQRNNVESFVYFALANDLFIEVKGHYLELEQLKKFAEAFPYNHFLKPGSQKTSR